MSPRARTRSKRSAPRRLLIFIVLLVVALVLLDLRLHPLIERVAAYEVRVYATRAVNDAILEELASYEIDYEDIVRVSWNDSGDVTAIQANMLEINRLKANVTRAVLVDLEAKGTRTLRLPLGTLLGNEYTAGRGPAVEIRVTPSGYVQTEIYSEFTSAGINQTLHQIMLKTSVQMTAVLPGFNIVTQSDTNFCIAQTVIVGNIPETYAEISLDDGPFSSRVGGYGALPTD